MLTLSLGRSASRPTEQTFRAAMPVAILSASPRVFAFQVTFLHDQEVTQFRSAYVAEIGAGSNSRALLASQKPSSLSVFVQSLLKCDIAGAELLFLENYEDLLGKVRNAVFELHHEQCDTNKCRKILLKSGFRETVLRATPTFSVNFMTRD